MNDDSPESFFAGLFAPPPKRDTLWEAFEATPLTKTPVSSIPIGVQYPPIPPANLIAKLLAAAPLVPLPNIPTASDLRPSKTTVAEVAKAKERFQRRLEQHQSRFAISVGRVVPDHDDLTIGDARRLNMAILYLDICDFSKMNSETLAEQERVLNVLNLFMAEMLGVVRAYGGDFEKNTGDGLMAYFAGKAAECAQNAVDAAITMHCYNDRVISPGLTANNLPHIRFRVGIDTGPVTVGNVGVRGDHRSLVAIGNTANVACKAMSLLPQGGIVLGHRARHSLSCNLQNETVALGQISDYFLEGTTSPYLGWELKYRVPEPSPWAEILTRQLSGM
jgi:adenylate cyclase